MAISFVAEDVKDLQPLFRLLYLVFTDFFSLYRGGIREWLTFLVAKRFVFCQIRRSRKMHSLGALVSAMSNDWCKSSHIISTSQSLQKEHRTLGKARVFCIDPVDLQRVRRRNTFKHITQPLTV